MKMTKSIIAKHISENANLTKNISLEILENFLLLISKNVKKSNVKISKFGTFYQHRSPKRVGRNPKTGESYIIRPMLKMNFKSSSKIKDILN